jgi:hypothetical protein
VLGGVGVAALVSIRRQSRKPRRFGTKLLSVLNQRSSGRGCERALELYMVQCAVRNLDILSLDAPGTISFLIGRERFTAVLPILSGLPVIHP